jgi:predicted  nucleic acid-binding Zn-ribbon protein
MRVRHRIPSIFNLFMVDVLCCALGCVIMVWLINLYYAKQQQDDAELKSRQTADRIAELMKTLDELEKKRGAIEGEATARAAAVRELEDKLKDATGRLATASADLIASRKEAATLKERGDDFDRRLAAAMTRTKELQSLADDLGAGLKKARSQSADADARATALEKEAATRQKELEELGKRYLALSSRNDVLAADLADRTKDLTTAKTFKEKWTADEERIVLLNKELTEAKASVEGLQVDKKRAELDLVRVKAQAEARFAGIALTGRRIVFLVDKSGSMKLLGEGKDQAAPEKWVEVRQSVAKLMRSLPALEKFQVVVFSDKPSYILGEPGRWLDYDPKTSADAVLKALSDVDPEGGTDMYAGLKTTFELRAQGLDTIYLLSDGLPNLGEGLKPGDDKKLSELEQGAVLGAYIRKKLKTEWNRPDERKNRVRINAVGFFYDSPDVGAFLWALARENDGSFVGMSKP